MANISPFELTEAFTMENFNNRIQTANTEINNLDTKINNLDTNKQDKDTAITTANIGSQSVNYANSAGNADTVDGIHANLDPGSYGMKVIAAGTGDLVAGSTALSNGYIYLVYE